MGPARAWIGTNPSGSGVRAVPLSAWLWGRSRGSFWVTQTVPRGIPPCTPACPQPPKSGFFSFSPLDSAMRVQPDPSCPFSQDPPSRPNGSQRGIWGINRRAINAPWNGGARGRRRQRGPIWERSRCQGMGTLGRSHGGSDAWGAMETHLAAKGPGPADAGGGKWRRWGCSDRGRGCRSLRGPPNPPRGPPTSPHRGPPGRADERQRWHRLCWGGKSRGWEPRRCDPRYQ